MNCCFGMEVAPVQDGLQTDKAKVGLTFMLRGADTSAGILLPLMNGYASGLRTRDKVCRLYFESEIRTLFDDRFAGAVDGDSLLQNLRLLVRMGEWDQFHCDYSQYLMKKTQLSDDQFPTSQLESRVGDNEGNSEGNIE